MGNGWKSPNIHLYMVVWSSRQPLIRPSFWGGYVRGGRLTSHDSSDFHWSQTIWEVHPFHSDVNDVKNVFKVKCG